MNTVVIVKKGTGSSNVHTSWLQEHECKVQNEASVASKRDSDCHLPAAFFRSAFVISADGDAAMTGRHLSEAP